LEQKKCSSQKLCRPLSETFRAGTEKCNREQEVRDQRDCPKIMFLWTDNDAYATNQKIAEYEPGDHCVDKWLRIMIYARAHACH
jgi:hypothetical protein